MNSFMRGAVSGEVGSRQGFLFVSMGEITAYYYVDGKDPAGGTLGAGREGAWLSDGREGTSTCVCGVTMIQAPRAFSPSCSVRDSEA